jgi:flagellar biogenesis protein FliO
MISAYLQMLFALGVVVGLIFLAGFFLKKRQTTGGVMKVLAFQHLGPRKGLVAVKVCDEVLLLSVTATDLRLLKTYEADEFKPEPGMEVTDKLHTVKSLREKFL